MIFEDYTYLTDEDIEKLLTSDELTSFQKVSLEFAVPHVHQRMNMWYP